MSLNELRNAHPYPTLKPNLRPYMHGWFHGEAKKVLSKHIGRGTKCIVEIGSWVGMSTQFFLERAPNATVICIDHWLGSEEHADHPLLPVLYDQFVVNMWHYRRRIIPVRMTSQSGLVQLQEHEIKPDLIWVDGSHATEDVAADLVGAFELSPRAKVFGDDWTWESVRDGVAIAAAKIDGCSAVKNYQGICYQLIRERVRVRN